MRGALIAQFLRADQVGIIPAHAGNTAMPIYWNVCDRDHPRACGEPTSFIQGRFSKWDHPRARGEHSIMRSRFSVLVGSSPRMRGTPSADWADRRCWGIIPAHAGNTRRYSHVSETCWDHPRACGEHMPPSCSMLIVEGSSPHMRGTHRRTARAGRHVGIIPAHAGNTIPTSPFRCSCRDHPRACGEHEGGQPQCFRFKGSSPRMRGTPFPHLRFVVPVGIIPAHAGNTSRPCMMPSLVQDHPRACGEHPYHALACSLRRGSSPRMRGTRGHVRSNGEVGGIIPAHAGNTHIMLSHVVCDGDHPRACGEHVVTFAPMVKSAGSSPRMRGTLNPATPEVDQTGIIPAHAGNTQCIRLPRMERRDHPRACGEHSSGIGMMRYGTGSSPRMRGTRRSWH